MKRGAGDEPAGQQQQHKKHKHGGRDRGYDRRADYHHRNGRHDQHSHGGRKDSNGPPPQKQRKTQSTSHEEALSKLPPSTSQSAEVPAHIPFRTPTGLPPLPSIKPGPLESAPFKHKSLTGYDRTSSSSDITYERLEFLGDAYIELIASRLIFERYPTLTAGRQSQVRELLVKNETLAEYSRAYGFEDKVEISAKEKMIEEASRKLTGNKGLNKVLGDVFEAYLAAVIQSDVENGFAVAEKWLTALWAPKLLEHVPRDDTSDATSSPTDSSASYNPAAKAELQKRILGPPGAKLDYERYADSVELKGAQLGQNKHFIAVYLTGYGHERKLLGKGEGRNKVEAGNWAAAKAMVEERELVERCEKEMLEGREKRRREKEEREKQAATSTASGEGKVRSGDATNGDGS